MSKPWKLIPLLFSLLTLTQTAPGLTQSRSLNILSEVRGTVYIKRARYNRAQRAYGGEFLGYSDRLKLGQGAAAKVLCTNLAIWNPRSRGEFSVSRGCPSVGAMILPESSRDVVRADGDFTKPYIISPRVPRNSNIKILDQQPTLRWNSVEEATYYQVELQELTLDGLTPIWTTETTESELVYRGEARLKPETYYQLIVKAYQGNSQIGEDSSFFPIVSIATAQEVREKIVELEKEQSLSEDAKALALARLYQSYDLNAAAVQVLEGLVEQGDQLTTVYQLLGDSYQQMGLFELAKAQYLTALAQAETEENLDTQAQIQISLAQIEEELEKLETAFDLLQAAQANYRILGDEEQVANLQSDLDKLQVRLAR